MHRYYFSLYSHVHIFSLACSLPFSFTFLLFSLGKDITGKKCFHFDVFAFHYIEINRFDNVMSTYAAVKYHHTETSSRSEKTDIPVSAARVDTPREQIVWSSDTIGTCHRVYAHRHHKSLAERRTTDNENVDMSFHERYSPIRLREWR